MASSEFAESCSKPDDVRLFSVTLPRPIAFTYLLSILYNITFFMQFMATPYFLKSLGVSDTENGYIQTLFGILQMCGGPLFGTIVQRFGIRFALHLCYGSTMISGILLYLSYDVRTLMISRIPCLFMHGQQGHQTLLSALTDPGKERTNAFGRMGLTFGLGFIFTPIFSFISTSFLSVSGPILVSAVLCIVPSLVLENCIERSSYENCRSEECEKPLQSMSVSNVVRILNKPGVLNVMFKKNAPILPMLLVFAIMQLYLVERFQADVNTGQAIQMMTGVCIMFSNGFGVIWMRKKFTEQTLLLIGMIFFPIRKRFSSIHLKSTFISLEKVSSILIVIGGPRACRSRLFEGDGRGETAVPPMTIILSAKTDLSFQSLAFGLFFFFHWLWMIVVVMPFIAFGMSLVATVADSLLTALVAENEQGLVLGVATSFNSLIRTFAPTISGYILETFGFSTFAVIGSLSTALGHAAIFLFPLHEGLLRKPKAE